MNISSIRSFHQLYIFQRILFNIVTTWVFSISFFDSGTIAGGSFNQLLQGRHYFHFMSLHKKTF